MKQSTRFAAGVTFCVVIALLTALLLCAMSIQTVYAATPERVISCEECGADAYYNSQRSSDPTCTTEGRLCYECYAGTTVHTTWVTLPATGHSWEEVEHVDATCTAAGYTTCVCTVCKQQETTKHAALGHTYSSTWTVEREPTEQSEGVEYKLCARCGNRIEQAIPRITSSDSPDENPEGGASAEGQDQDISPTDDESRDAHSDIDAQEAYGQGDDSALQDGADVSGVQGDVAQETESALRTDEKSSDSSDVPLGALAGGVVGAAVVVGVGYGLIIRPRRLAAAGARAAKVCSGVGTAAQSTSASATQALETASSAQAAEQLESAFDPSRNPKTVLLCLDENTASGTLVKLMRGRHFLSVRTLDPNALDTVPQTVEDMKPDLTVLHIDSPDDLDRLVKVIATTRQSVKDATFAFVVDDMVDGVRDDALAADVALRLDSLIADGTIMAYVFDSANDNNELVRLILPLYKSSIAGDNALGALGAVADVMGIPGVATAVELFCNSREIKDVMASGDMSVGDKAAVIGDIASILGIEEIANVSDFIDSANTIKETMYSDERNASERADVAEAGAHLIGTIFG